MQAPLPPPPVLPAPSPLSLEDVTWRVVQVEGQALFALDAHGYEALSRNMAEIARWMQESGWQLGFYLSTRKPAPPIPGVK